MARRSRIEALEEKACADDVSADDRLFNCNVDHHVTVTPAVALTFHNSDYITSNS